MIKEAGSATSGHQRSSRKEVWLFVAVSLFALLGFMATLSTGNVQEAAGGGEPQVEVSAEP